MEQLYNRGLATRDEVLQALRESRLKNKYGNLAFDLHQRIIPARSLDIALRHGVISHEQAVRLAMESGYSKEDATILVNSGSAGRIQTYKDRVVASAQTLYEDSIIDSKAAESIIKGVGFTAEETSFVLKAAEFHRESRDISQVVSVIKSKYLSRHLVRTTASGLLDQAHIPAQQRDRLLKLWDIERNAYTRVLTPAEVAHAVKKQFISPEDGVARLIADGYSEGDAILRLAL
jgi:hypothetical protein